MIVRSICRYFLLFLLMITPFLIADPVSAKNLIGYQFETQDMVFTKDFSGENLQKAGFKRLNLSDANFSNADLQGVVFDGTNLKSANFHGANFANGLSYLVIFDDTDLSDAIFTDAMMLRTAFEDNVNIKGTDFTGAILEVEQQKKLCSIASGVNSKTGVATKDSLGCY